MGGTRLGQNEGRRTLGPDLWKLGPPHSTKRPPNLKIQTPNRKAPRTYRTVRVLLLGGARGGDYDAFMAIGKSRTVASLLVRHVVLNTDWIVRRVS